MNLGAFAKENIMSDNGQPDIHTQLHMVNDSIDYSPNAGLKLDTLAMFSSSNSFCN